VQKTVTDKIIVSPIVVEYAIDWQRDLGWPWTVLDLGHVT